MAFKYYCTYCGRRLDQETVLFDMQTVLTGSEVNRFHILSFRMTAAELEALIASGTQQGNYRQCTLTLPELMKYAANGNNLKDPDVETLTVDEIRDYTVLKKVEEAPRPAFSPFNVFAAKAPEEPKEEEAADEPETLSPAILALERASQKNEDRKYTRDNVREELTVLQSLFASGEAYTFKIRENWENDNNGEKVLVGYTVRNGMPEHDTEVNARVCPHCGEPVFEHAGTAEHRTVTFIGDQKAGKTSTILALAHYAKRAAGGAMPGDDIWFGSKKINALASIELVSPCEQLVHDLENYENGIAPMKTAALQRSDAYICTLRIKNTAQENKHYLLTLTDLPGELCFDNGRIDRNKILNEFQIALACDVFVLCFDSETATGPDAADMVSKAGSWANDFQQLRSTLNADPGQTGEGEGWYVPVMLIFNKCPDLEKPELVPPPRAVTQFDSILMTYVFDRERLILDADPVYQRVGQQIGSYGALNSAYHARLRVSPFGFAAPIELHLKEDPQRNRDENGNIRRPKPKHVPELMNWLLEASGCIPVEAKYFPDPSYEDRVCQEPDNFSEKPQYRSEIPSGKGRNGDVREALLRCHLFENPNPTDIAILESFDQRAVLLGERIKAFFRKRKAEKQVKT